MTDGLILGAVPKRAPFEDVWLSREGQKLTEIPAENVVGTSSPRRRAQLLNTRPDLRVADVRGNIETRLRKLTDGLYDALIMARAGLERAGLEGAITEILPVDKFIPAPGQGALAVQIRQDDEEVKEITGTINDIGSHRCLEIERALLARLKAGCSTPIGGICWIENDGLSLEAVVLDRDGKKRLFESHRIMFGEDDNQLVDKVVEGLLAQGADKLIESF
jgi:hydroxymethylbilane synthase